MHAAVLSVLFPKSFELLQRSPRPFRTVQVELLLIKLDRTDKEACQCLGRYQFWAGHHI